MTVIAGWPNRILWMVFLVHVGCSGSGTTHPGDLAGDSEAGDIGATDWSRWDAPADADIEDASRSGDAECVDCAQGPDAPEVRGEASAGHPHPTWLWNLPAGATGFRFRLDQGSWEEAAADATSYTSVAPLEPGSHLFEVQALGSGQTSASGAFETVVEYFERPGFWNGVVRELARSPLGNEAAISAHNCYLALIDPVTSLDVTSDVVQEAITRGADLIELDIKDEGGVIHVDHDDDGSVYGAHLGDVLDDPVLQAADQILFIEIKEKEPTEAFIADLLDLLDARREHYARNGRPVVLRTFHSKLENLSLARQLLDAGAYPLIEHYVRLSVLFGKDNFPDLATFQEEIAQAAASGYGMVEFHYQDQDLFGKLVYARSLGLGINVWTVPVSMGEVFVTGLREEVDAITTDWPADKARAAVEEDNVLVYLNAWDQPHDGDTVTWHKEDGGLSQAGINEPDRPSGEDRGVGQGLFGTVLTFEPESSQHLPLYDADCLPDSGVLVTVAVRFDSLDLEDGETRAILAKSDMAGWTLELHDPPGEGGALIRFGVFVDDLYRYAYVPADWVLNEADAFFLVGAYDGDGQVRLWVNNQDGSVVGEVTSGGVVNNDSLALLGADPQGAAKPRYFFNGAVQQAMVLRWDEH